MRSNAGMANRQGDVDVSVSVNTLAWLGLAWLGLAWLGLAWLGLAWLLLTPSMKMEQTLPRNVGVYNSDSGESRMRNNTTLRIRRKFEIKN